MPNYVRFRDRSTHAICLGTIEADIISECSGASDELWAESHKPTGRTVALADVDLLAPFQPRSVIGLWNNFFERATLEGNKIPDVVLYFMKPPGSVIGPNDTIVRPACGPNAVKFEAELGIVIGAKCCQVSEEEATSYVFGFCCVNDVTAVPYLKEDPSFQQWTRSKGFDTFCPIGPAVTTDRLDLTTLRVQAVQNGKVQQDYPVSDMIFSPYKIVSMLSHYQTLWPGDLIACGTSVGAKNLEHGDTIEVTIPGIGSLSNPFSNKGASGKRKLENA